VIYLSKLTLNPRSRQVQSELARPYEMHRTLMSAFPDGVRRVNANLLHRLEIHPQTGTITLLAQSTLEPDWGALENAGQGRYLLNPPQYKPISLNLPTGLNLQFRLVANPTIKKKRDGKKNSNRIPLVREEKQLEWLHKKSIQHGFVPLHTQVRPIGNQTSRKRQLTIYNVKFEGLLQITDDDAFARALQTGIGPAKAFGCGLLSLAPGR